MSKDHYESSNFLLASRVGGLDFEKKLRKRPDSTVIEKLIVLKVYHKP